MDLKSLQYLMGHADAGMVMNVHTHASYDHAAQSMQKILSFKKTEIERKMVLKVIKIDENSGNIGI